MCVLCKRRDKLKMKRATKQKDNKPKDPRDKGIFQRKDAEGNVTWWARIVRVDGNGKPHQFTRRANDKSHARRLKRELEDEHDDNGEQGLDGARMVFRELAGHYKKSRLFEAIYHGEGEAQRKVGGLRSYKAPQGFLETLTAHFGAKLIRNITHDDIEQFKLTRLSEPTRGDVASYERELKKNPKAELRSTRTIASANRELELMRAVMRFAQRQGWLSRSPFEMGSPLISKADERRRERVLTHDEEQRLLEACGPRTLVYTLRGKQITTQDDGERRSHLRALIIAALDTAMRRGELFKLVWRDVDLENRLIKIVALNSKTARPRTVAITPRLYAELERLRAQAPDDPEIPVFGVKDTVKRSFAAACKAAEIEGFRFHDCRHTAITRMVQAKIAPMEIMKISGHTQHVTFTRYVNPDTSSIYRAADALAAYNAAAAAKDATETVN
jgi:integrase